MSMFHFVVLPLATLVAIFMGAKSGMAKWKYGALVAGCGLMLGGLWSQAAWSTALLIVGGVLFSVGLPRLTKGAPPIA